MAQLRFITVWLDPLPAEAEYIDQKYSVLVAAPTGVGKTLLLVT